MTKYKVTKPHIHCDYRCTPFVGYGHIYDCIHNCLKYVDTFEETYIMTAEELLNEINGSNCYITKVEVYE